MKKAIILLVACSVFLIGCTETVLQLTSTPQPTAAPTTTPASYHYLALGDSYTIGEGVSTNQRFPVLLTSALRKNGIYLDAPIIIAQTGWTSDDLEAVIAEEDPQGPFDMVTILIGVNDQVRGRNLDVYRDKFQGLLITAIELAGGDASRVIVISIPDWGVTPAASGQDELKIADEIDAYNAANRALAEEQGAYYVNITDITRLAFDDRMLLARDGLHPAGKMYRMWVELLLPKALEILGQ